MPVRFATSRTLQWVVPSGGGPMRERLHPVPVLARVGGRMARAAGASASAVDAAPRVPAGATAGRS